MVGNGSAIRDRPYLLFGRHTVLYDKEREPARRRIHLRCRRRSRPIEVGSENDEIGYADLSVAIEVRVVGFSARNIVLINANLKQPKIFQGDPTVAVNIPFPRTRTTTARLGGAAAGNSSLKSANAR